MARVGAFSAILLFGWLLLAATIATEGFASAQEATPPSSSCDAPPVPSTPMADTGSMAGMAMATPGGTVEFDRLYIDMMIPHHQSVIALAQAALPRLTDPRLKAIAQDIIDAQSAEIPELEGYRQQFYGSAQPQPLDQGEMAQMMQAMSGGAGDMSQEASAMDQMQMQMDPTAEVATFCSAENPDLAFIDLTIPHHQSAVMASQAALTQATHQEIKDFAQKVIASQQAEIDQLQQIRQDLTGGATPVA
jgi:uncharacterized protein (DUF305 family)